VPSGQRHGVDDHVVVGVNDGDGVPPGDVEAVAVRAAARAPGSGPTGISPVAIRRSVSTKTTEAAVNT